MPVGEQLVGRAREGVGGAAGGGGLTWTEKEDGVWGAGCEH